jgi:hypothetical protein
MQFNGTSWIPLGAPGFSAAGISAPSVAYDSLGNVFVAFQDMSGPPLPASPAPVNRAG